MIGSFRPSNKISHNKWAHMVFAASKQALREPLLMQSYHENFSDDCKMLVFTEHKRLETFIKTEHINLPRKEKKVYKRLISAKYNAFLLTLQKWDRLKREKDKEQESTESLKEQL